jgi:hypothetical protein
LPGASAISSLSTKAEALDQLTVALDVYVLKVAKQAATLTDQEQKTTA